ncbi:hypothetical protein AZF37_07685 [endosymbiont 'TC1' of Trimyema compressum]|nr:hypothetical protein AZF37_07685 [endosymbiont 'TC1' of Trimyema compressum]
MPNNDVILYAQRERLYGKINEIFPDAKLAQIVANMLSGGGDVNAQLTSVMVNNCTNITASNSGITDITGIEELNKLQILDLHNNNITNIPTKIGTLSDLQYLNLSNNLISVVPSEIANLTKLTELDLDSNQLISFPDVIGNLTNLVHINLAANQLTNLTFLGLADNLLPNNYQDKLNSLGLSNIVFNYEAQAELVLKEGISPYTIKSISDISAIALNSLVEVKQAGKIVPLFANQKLILTDYVDSTNGSVSIDDYTYNGLVIKAGNFCANSNNANWFRFISSGK